MDILLYIFQLVKYLPNLEPCHIKKIKYYWIYIPIILDRNNFNHELELHYIAKIYLLRAARHH